MSREDRIKVCQHIMGKLASKLYYFFRLDLRLRCFVLLF